MFSHGDIWRGIDRLAGSLGYSPSGLAKKAGLDPTAFNKSKRVSPDGKPRWPSTESLSKILAVTSTTMSDFILLIGAENDNDMPSASSNIPVIGFAQAGENGFFNEDGYPAGDSWNTTNLPAFDDTGVYAIEVSGDSMEPLYRSGDLLVVDPSSKMRKNDRVIVKTKDGEVLAKQLTRKSAKEIRLQSLNKDYEDRTFSPDGIEWMARIVWVSQ